MRLVQNNQKKLCADVYNNNLDALNVKDADSADIGPRVIIFLSYLGSDRLM